jgi:UDP-2,4-diacetamido-2,4,6-trideoxy-beta-L-altropyranose hydrolase
MRCLTLAAALRERGDDCRFICRGHPGNLIEYVRELGFEVTALNAGDPGFDPAGDGPDPQGAHAQWLGAGWQADAEATRQTFDRGVPDWLVVDHYALDRKWETALRPYCGRLMAMDDLADRPHDCDLLLDQNLGRMASDYSTLVPAACTVLAGAPYAMLRPEFSALREYSLRRRNPPRLRRLLVTMGGVDRANVTGRVLDMLARCPLPQDCRITVVMGVHAPWIQDVQAQTRNMPRPCDVRVNASDMAQLMADSDLAIGAAGSTSWERCCVGLPSIIVVLANNQARVAEALAAAGAASSIYPSDQMEEELRGAIAALASTSALARMSSVAASLVDGRGLVRTLSRMEQKT